jgi:hypothetical protein
MILSSMILPETKKPTLDTPIAKTDHFEIGIGGAGMRDWPGINTKAFTADSAWRMLSRTQ